MRVAVISDIHGNLPALEAVLADMPEVDEVMCLGDLVGYGGNPRQCVEAVIEAGWPTLVGNHDRACTSPEILEWFNADAATVVRWTRDQLTEDQLTWLAALPEQTTRNGVLLVHASPRDPIFEYILDLQTATENLELLGTRVCFHGHSHIPGIFQYEEGRVYHDYRQATYHLRGPVLINPGSVGQPRDGDPAASYGIWDVDHETFTYRRVPYDVTSAQVAILSAGLPERFAARLQMGR